jgi:hypothetical protein
VSNSSDQLNERIDRNLREAHQQISMRPEFAERVLSEIADERERNKVAWLKSTAPTTGPWRQAWLRVAMFAAAMLIAILWGSWLMTSRDLSKKTEEVEVGIDKETIGIDDKTIAHNAPRNILELESSDGMPRQLDDLAVSATPGYLASKLYDDAEIEVYVVLPTLRTEILE